MAVDLRELFMLYLSCLILMLFSIVWWKVLASIDFLDMASSNGEASIRVDSTDKEKSVDDRFEALLEKNPQLILMKFFVDLAKKNPPAKEGKAPPRKEPLSPPTIIPDDAWSSTVGDAPTCSDSTITGFTDYTSE